MLPRFAPAGNSYCTAAATAHRKAAKTMSQFWSDIVHELTPYVPGEQPKPSTLVNLTTNESPYGPSPEAIAAIRAAAGDELRLYPDPVAERLRETVAAYYGLTAGQVFMGI